LLALTLTDIFIPEFKCKNKTWILTVFYHVVSQVSVFLFAETIQGDTQIEEGRQSVLPDLNTKGVNTNSYTNKPKKENETRFSFTALLAIL